MTKRKFLHPECIPEFLKMYRSLQIKNPSLSESETWDYASRLLHTQCLADTYLWNRGYKI